MKEYAIKENHLFVKAFNSNNRFATPRICVHLLKDYKARRLMIENPKKEYINRIGFSVTPKLGNAVKRNRCKRIMRAAYRRLVSETSVKKGFLVVIAARNGAVASNSEEIYSDLKRAFNYLGLTDKSSDNN